MTALNRRSVISGGAAGLAVASFGVPVSGKETATDADVVIVGAGVAGLAAAHALRAARRSFILLEARQRIGGRALTESRSLGEPWDRGAAWLHISERNPLIPIARRLRLPTTVTPTSVVSLQRDGRSAPEALIRSYVEARQRIDRMVGEALSKGGDAPLSAVRGTTAAQAFACDLTALTMGEPAASISLRDLASMDDGTDRMVAGGLGALVNAYGRVIPVRLGAAVSAVDWSGRGVRIEGAFGVLRAKAALITVPTAVLSTGSIRFTPDLPATTQQALADLPLGRFTKIGVRTAAPLTLPRQHSMDLGIWDGGRPHVLHQAPGSAIATVLISGSLASEIDAAGEAAAADFARQVVAGVAGADAARAIIATTLTRWGSDPHALGAYSFVRPGAHDARARYGEPVGGRLWFAGEASATRQAVTVGGAFLAGAKAAREIARSV